MGSHSLLQGIFPTQGLNLGLLYCRQLLNHLSHRACWATVHGGTESDSNERPAAAAAASLQSCPTLCDPIDGSPPGSSVYGILQARILDWVAVSFSNACMHAKSLRSCPILCDPTDSSPPGSSVHGILQARELEWVAMPSSSGKLPDLGIKPLSLTSPALAGYCLHCRNLWHFHGDLPSGLEIN